MPVILCRHGATAKNIEGGTDDRWTKLHADGITQSIEMGARLLDFCQKNGIARLQPLTSGYDRTNASCVAALQAFAGSDVEIRTITEDERIGEIKFRPRDILPTAEMPGIFGRVIDGPSLAEVLKKLSEFNAERLQTVPADTALVVFGHRTTNRLLAMMHLGRDIAWMEALPRMDNCETWLMGQGDIEVLHPGYPASRDEPDPRREALK